MSTSLLQDWKVRLQTCSSFCRKVYRYLILVHGQRAGDVAFPLPQPPAVELQVDAGLQSKHPRSPGEIRILMARIAEAVGRSAT